MNTSPAEIFDVAVVGARCAGAPLATLLAREGINVALIEQSTFPSETLSSHIFEADGLAILSRLGVIDKLGAVGAPMVNRTDTRVEDVRMVIPWPQAPGDIGGVASIRRGRLDPVLADAAERAGASVFMSTKAVSLPARNGRIGGLRVADPSSERELRARLVVGADGRSSTVARLAGARKYNVTANQRALYWAYFEGAQMGAEPTFVSHRWGDRWVLGIPTDGGLYQVLIWPELGDRERLRADLEGTFMEHALRCEPVARAIAGARRVDRIVGAVSWEGYFREAAGPGWVLVGDAGHFKDPAPGRGISDALLQAEALSSAIAGGLEGSDDDLDDAMTRWGRWRDDEFAEHYWLASDLGAAGKLPAVLPEVFRALQAKGRADLFFDLLNHRAEPSKVLSPPRLLGATARALLRHRRPWVLGEVAALGAQDMRRRKLNRRPEYAPHSGSAQPAGGTGGS